MILRFSTFGAVLEVGIDFLLTVFTRVDRIQNDHVTLLVIVRFWKQGDDTTKLVFFHL